MKTIFSPRKRHYLKRVSFLLIAVALVAAMVSCDGEPTPTRYNLTMAEDPPGYGTAVDVTGAGAYEAGAVVDIEAIANPGYQFVIWSTTGGTLGDANAATTTLTMPAQNVTVTAHFVGPLDHFTCYDAEGELGPLDKVVSLEDQFIAINTTVTWPELFCNPVEKYHDDKLTEISNDDHHLMLYSLDYPEGEWGTWLVEVDNQFGTQNLTVMGPVLLAVPTQKLEPGDHEPPLGLDHFLVYFVDYTDEPPSMLEDVVLNDQFDIEPDATVLYPVLFANPVRKIHGTEVTEIRETEEHLLFYSLEGVPFQTTVDVDNQFGEQTLNLWSRELLAVPSTKTELLPPALDHFKCYGAEGDCLYDWVLLEDQFLTVPLEARVDCDWYFGNPVEKLHDGVPTPILYPDNHLTIYTLSYEATLPWWSVEVYNQFGLQELLVSDPAFLAVPTQKLEPGDHGPPVGLDHFLLYEVEGGQPMGAYVDLHDQFGYEEAVLVLEPLFFANPVQKTHGTVTPIQDSQAHLVFYGISGGTFDSFVLVDNQFLAEPLQMTVYDPALLAVPSLKLSADIA